MSITELVSKHNLYSQVAALIQGYHQKLQPLKEKYQMLLAMSEIPEDSAAHELYLDELKPYWIKLGNDVRKLVRKADKQGIR